MKAKTKAAAIGLTGGLVLIGALGALLQEDELAMPADAVRVGTAGAQSASTPPSTILRPERTPTTETSVRPATVEASSATECRGRVVGADGAALPDATVELLKLDGITADGWEPARTITLDAEGRFRLLISEQAERAVLRASAPGYQAALAPLRAGSVVLTLTPVPVATQTASDGYTIRGEVLDADGAPVADAAVVVRPTGLRDAEVTARTRAAANGVFTVRVPGRRAVRLRAGAPGYAAAAQVVKADHLGAVRLVLRRAASEAAALTVTVVDDAGRPIEGANAELGAARGETDAAGRVELTSTAGELIVRAAGYAPRAAAAKAGGSVRVELAPAARLTVTARPEQDLTLIAGSEVRTVRVDGSGRASFADLPPGPARVLALDASGPVAQAITLRSGRHDRVSLTPRRRLETGTIEGRVRSGVGPAVDVLVRIRSKRAGDVVVSTDDAGRFVTGRLAIGRYSLEVDGRRSGSVQVMAGRPVRVELDAR